MRSVHLTLALFCQLLLASVVIYFTSSTAASPLFSEHELNNVPVVLKQASSKQHVESHASADQVMKSVASPLDKNKAAEPKVSDAPLEARSNQVVVAPVVKTVETAAVVQTEAQTAVKAAPISEEKMVAPVVVAKEQASVVAKTQVPNSSKQEFSAKSAADSILTKKDSDTVQPSVPEQKRPRKEVDAVAAPTSPLDTQQLAKPQQVDAVKQDKKPAVAPQAAALVAEPPASAELSSVVVESSQKSAPAVPTEPVVAVVVHKEPIVSVVTKDSVELAKSPAHVEAVPVPVKAASPPQQLLDVQPSAPVVKSPAARSPVVQGGLGPLHLLATTLCSYQPDKSVADENLNQLYARRASVRKSLFDFMSLKFTNLEKLSSRLGYGLQVVPAVAKGQTDDSSSNSGGKGLLPSHGWPVVGKCTAYDLKLMGEAAWCECQDSENCNQQEGVKPSSTSEQSTSGQQVVDASSKVDAADDKPASITSNQHAMMSNRVMSARAISSPEATYSLLPSPEDSSVISKILRVSDIKSAPLVESSIYNLNLTQHQLATLEAHATSTQECRRNALRYSKALFNHLAEDQRTTSDSWPKLYAAISADDCARKRMIDIVNALSGFRTDTTSIRRDNLEFAFAMDDLRAKVLENEVNVPLTFDRHFIEVEQFLQQSVRLMLANIQPKRAKLTSMRYRSLMYGSSSDEQCIDLHQRLLARNYPSDCNPTQFGQLPDVLRMTASSLELWSIEKELSMRMAKIVDYPNESPAGQQKVKEDVNECIANLVSS